MHGAREYWYDSMHVKPFGGDWCSPADSESGATARRWYMTTNIVNKRTACSPNNPTNREQYAFLNCPATRCSSCYISYSYPRTHQLLKASDVCEGRNVSAVCWINVSCRLFIDAILHRSADTLLEAMASYRLGLARQLTMYIPGTSCTAILA